jgi:type IV fimbrial biogenesis protein FimT
MLDNQKRWFMLNMALNRGFTIIELMISIALLGLVLILAMPSYRAFIQNSYIRTAAESIQSGLQLARAEAVSRNTQVQFVLGVNSAWSIGCVTPSADCPAVIQSRAAGDGSSSSIVITPTPEDATTVIFSNLGATVTSADALTQVDLDIDPSVLPAAESRELRVTIGIGGNARMCDPNLSAGDARAC